MVTKSLSVNGKEYQILKLLGKGKGGYSYLACDGNRNVVLKQIHHEPCSYYQFGNKIQAEINDYKCLSKIGILMPVMIDIDIKKERIVKEFIAGKTAYEMCGLLYPANTNIDYFPTNFVLQDGILYYIDYECNDYMDEWNFENWGIKYWSKTKEFLDYVNEHA